MRRALTAVLVIILSLTLSAMDAQASRGEGAFDAAQTLEIQGLVEATAANPVFFAVPNGMGITLSGVAEGVVLHKTSSDATRADAGVRRVSVQDGLLKHSEEETTLGPSRVRLTDIREDAGILVFPLSAGFYTGVRQGEILGTLTSSPAERLTFDHRSVKPLLPGGSGPYFGPFWTISTPHVNLSSAGRYVFEGDFGLFLYGVDYVVESTGRTVRGTTGVTTLAEAGAIARTHWENATLLLTDAVLEIASDSPLTSFYACEMEIALTGAAVLDDATGAFTAPDLAFRADGEPLALEGALRFVASAPEENANRMALAVSGELDSVPLTMQSVRTAPGGAGDAWPAWALATGSLAFLGVGAVVAVGVQRRRRSVASPANADELVEHAVFAMGDGDYATALVALERAMAVKGADVRLFVDRGHCLEKLGRLKEARAAYERAVTLAPGNAEAHFYYSRALAQMTLTPGALSHLTKAVSMNGSLRDMARRDKGFRALADDPRFVALVG